MNVRQFGALYENREGLKDYFQFVAQSIEQFQVKYGYAPERLEVSADVKLEEPTLFGFPTKALKRVSIANCLIYPVVKRREPMLPIKERFPI